MGARGAVATGASTAADRAALARSVLRLAEERTGATRFAPRPGRRGPDGVPGDPAAAGADSRTPGGTSVTAGAASAPVLTPLVAPDVAPARPALPGAAVVRPAPPDSGADGDPEAAARLLPVPTELGGLLPEGALRRGATVVVAGSTSLVLRLLADVSRSGGWVALVGLPDVGVLAAHQLGLALDRVALVPEPGPEAPTAVAALLDGVDAVVVGPAVALSDADRRRLSARARERSAVLLPTAPWPGAHVVLSAERSRWEGLGQGSGRLHRRSLTVRRAGRGAAGRATVLDVTVPALPHPWSAADDAPQVVEILDGTTAGVPDHRRAG